MPMCVLVVGVFGPPRTKTRGAGEDVKVHRGAGAVVRCVRAIATRNSSLSSVRLVRGWVCGVGWHGGADHCPPRATPGAPGWWEKVTALGRGIEKARCCVSGVLLPLVGPACGRSGHPSSAMIGPAGEQEAGALSVRGCLSKYCHHDGPARTNAGGIAKVLNEGTSQRFLVGASPT